MEVLGCFFFFSSSSSLTYCLVRFNLVSLNYKGLLRVTVLGPVSTKRDGGGKMSIMRCQPRRPIPWEKELSSVSQADRVLF